MQSFSCFQSVQSVDSYQPVACFQRNRCTHFASVKSAFRRSRHAQLRRQNRGIHRRIAGTSTPIVSAKVSLSSGVTAFKMLVVSEIQEISRPDGAAVSLVPAVLSVQSPQKCP